MKAVVAAYFGAAEPRALAAMDLFEAELAEALPGRRICRAFLRERQTVPGVDTLEQAMEKLRDAVQVLVLPVLVSRGPVFENLLRRLEPFGPQVAVGLPLLCTEEAWEAAAPCLAWRQPGEALVLVCHNGTAAFPGGPAGVFPAALDLGPEALIRQLKQQPLEKVCLVPFLMTVGRHFHRDLAQSWRQQLEQAGYTVRCIERGLLEYPEIRQRLIGRVRQGGSLWV